MRALILATLLGVGLAGCKAPDGLIVVTVTASPALPSVAYLHVVGTVGTRTMSYDVGRGLPAFSLPPAKTFAFDLSSVSSGNFEVSVEARNSAGVVLAHGDGMVAIANGARRDVTITLAGSVVASDMAGIDAMPADFAGCVSTVTCASLSLTCGRASDGCGGTLDCTPCQLNAIEQPLGIAGNSILIEGKMNPVTMVNFPGGASVSATLLGPNRASVVVPMQATSGSMTITSGGMTTPPLPFRRPTFAMGLPISFTTQYEQAEYARQTPALNPPRSGNSVVVAGNWLFVLGGFNAGALDDVERAMINADGTLGAFVPNGKLTTASTDHASVVLGNYVYVIGGANGSALMRVERAAIGANGVLGSFADAGVSLTVPRSGATATIVGDYLYVIGGSTGATPLATIERAPIGGDGTLGAFTDAGLTLRTARSLHSAAVSGNFLYVVGGNVGGTTVTARVERAPINGDGTIGAFVDQMANGVQLMAKRSSHQMQFVGGNVYILAGTDAGALSSVESAAVGSDGSIGAFSTLAGVTAGARAEFGSAVIGNYIYEIGGDATNGGIDRATINASSALPTFTNAPIKLAVAGAGPGVVVGNTLYLVSGANSQHAPINADGSLGAFVADKGITAGGRLAVLGNYVYAVAGQRAPINDDGTIGPWAAVAVTGKTTTASYGLIVAGPTLYSIGGSNASFDGTPTVEAATPAADGSLAFATTSIPQLSANITRGNVALLNGNIITYSGYDGGAGGTVHPPQRSTLNASHALGTWSQLGMIITNFDPASLVVGTKIYMVAGRYTGTTIYSAAITDASFGMTANGMTQAGRAESGTLVTSSFAYSFGGNNAGTTNYDTIEQAAFK